MPAKLIICPICKKECYGFNKIRNHFIEYHNGEMNMLYSGLTSQNEVDDILKMHDDVHGRSSIVNKYNNLFTEHSPYFSLFLKDYNRIPWTAKQVKNGEPYKRLFANTCINKYGVDNPSKLQSVKDKKVETFFNNYGVKNIFCTEEVTQKRNFELRNYYNDKDRMESRNEKYKNSLMDEYGVDNVSKIPEVAKKISKTKKHNYSLMTEEEKYNITLNARIALSKIDMYESKIEKRVQKILDDNDIKYIKHVFYKQLNYDILIFPNLFIEIQGTIWHCDPRKYKSTDIVIGHKAEDIWKKDERKKMLVLESSKKFLELWESDINTSSDEQLLKIIKDKINE